VHGNPDPDFLGYREKIFCNVIEKNVDFGPDYKNQHYPEILDRNDFKGTPGSNAGSNKKKKEPCKTYQ
jgi:hypothetical protein